MFVYIMNSICWAMLALQPNVAETAAAHEGDDNTPSGC